MKIEQLLTEHKKGVKAKKYNKKPKPLVGPEALKAKAKAPPPKTELEKHNKLAAKLEGVAEGFTKADADRNKARDQKAGRIGHGVGWKDSGPELVDDIVDHFDNITRLVQFDRASEPTKYKMVERFFKKYGYPFDIFSEVILGIEKRAAGQTRRLGRVEETAKLSTREKFKRSLKRAGYDPDAGAKRIEDLLAKQKKEREEREKQEKEVKEAKRPDRPPPKTDLKVGDDVVADTSKEDYPGGHKERRGKVTRVGQQGVHIKTDDSDEPEWHPYKIVKKSVKEDSDDIEVRLDGERVPGTIHDFDHARNKASKLISYQKGEVAEIYVNGKLKMRLKLNTPHQHFDEKDMKEAKQPEAPKPRNFVAKNMKTAGAGKHKDAKKATKEVRGQKHKNKEMAEMTMGKVVDYKPGVSATIDTGPGMTTMLDLKKNPTSLTKDPKTGKLQLVPNTATTAQPSATTQSTVKPGDQVEMPKTTTAAEDILRLAGLR